MRNASLLFFVLLSLNFSTYPMLRSVRSRAAAAAQGQIGKLEQEKRNRIESLQLVKRDLEKEERELCSKIATVRLLQGRYMLARRYVDAGETKHKQIKDIVLGYVGTRINMEQLWLLYGNTPTFEGPLVHALDRGEEALKRPEERLQEELRLVREYRDKCDELLEINKLD